MKTDSVFCPICVDPHMSKAFDELSETGHGRSTIAALIGVTEYAIRKHRSVCSKLETVEIKDSAPKGWAGGVEVVGDSGSICSGPVDSPVTDWSELLKIWGLDSTEFEVIEPVTFKAWDGFAKSINACGDTELITKRLYSYKANIRRITKKKISVDSAKWSANLLTTYYSGHAWGKEAADSSYVILIADPQLGKPGTEEAVRNWELGFTRHLECVDMMRSQHGVYPTALVVAFMGDEHENVKGNYESQPYEVELNLSEQIQLDFDLRVWSIREALAFELPLTVVSVVSNHGEFTRAAKGKPATSLYDNSSTMVSRLVKKLFDEAVPATEIDWLIAEDSPDVVTDISGVKTLFTHGHISKGSGRSSEFRTKSAIEKQILGRTAELGDVELFFSAHYHHFSCVEQQGRTYFGCPALEAERASKYFIDKYGVWSKPGMLGMLVGSNIVGGRGWSEASVL